MRNFKYNILTYTLYYNLCTKNFLPQLGDTLLQYAPCFK